MVIAKPEYDRLRDAAAQTAVLTAQVASLTTTADWLRVRVNQLEHERATLFQAVTKLPMNVPSIRPTEPYAASSAPPPATLRDMAALFDDVGDTLARELGIDHDADGRLVYTK